MISGQSIGSLLILTYDRARATQPAHTTACYTLRTTLESH